MWTKDGKKNFQVQRRQKLSCMRYRPPSCLSSIEKLVRKSKSRCAVMEPLTAYMGLVIYFQEQKSK